MALRGVCSIAAAPWQPSQSSCCTHRAVPLPGVRRLRTQPQRRAAHCRGRQRPPTTLVSSGDTHTLGFCQEIMIVCGHCLLLDCDSIELVFHSAGLDQTHLSFSWNNKGHVKLGSLCKQLPTPHHSQHKWVYSPLRGRTSRPAAGPTCHHIHQTPRRGITMAGSFWHAGPPADTRSAGRLQFRPHCHWRGQCMVGSLRNPPQPLPDSWQLSVPTLLRHL